MASGKLSPRQKMINMMYLVLTALLALQVSAEIMDAFQQIADTMRDSTQRLASKNKNLGDNIEATIISNAGGDREAAEKTKDWKYVGLINEIRSKTNQTVAQVEKIREGLFSDEVSGVKDDDDKYKDYGAGLLKNPGDTDNNYRYWMGEGTSDTDNDGRGAGKAFELRKVLQDYVKWANGFAAEHFKEKDKFEDIVREPKDRLPDEPEYREARSHTWEYNSFHAMPAVANLATLEMYKQQLRVIESDLLQVIRSKLNKFEFKIDSLIGKVAPKSTVVFPGLSYEAEVFVAATSTEAIPQYSGQVRQHPKNPNMGQVKIPIGDINFGQNSKITRKWAGNITVTKADGTTDNIPVNGEYDILKLGYVIQSVAVNSVYRNCANGTMIDVPALSANGLYNPVLSANGGHRVVPSKKDPRKVQLLPLGGGSKMVVNIASMINGKKVNIDKAVFGIKNPPKPDINVFADGKPAITGATVSATSNVIVQVKPQDEFLAQLPQDARYQIIGGPIEMIRGLGSRRAVANVPTSQVANKPTIKVNMSSARPQRGDQIYITIKAINRINYMNKAFTEPFSKRELIYSFNVR